MKNVHICQFLHFIVRLICCLFAIKSVFNHCCSKVFLNPNKKFFLYMVSQKLCYFEEQKNKTLIQRKLFVVDKPWHTNCNVNPVQSQYYVQQFLLFIWDISAFPFLYSIDYILFVYNSKMKSIIYKLEFQGATRPDSSSSGVGLVASLLGWGLRPHTNSPHEY